MIHVITLDTVTKPPVGIHIADDILLQIMPRFHQNTSHTYLGEVTHFTASLQRIHPLL